MVLYCAMLYSYNILVHAYGMSGMLAEMEETVHQLKDSGYAPDQYTYNILISAYGEVEMPYASLRVSHGDLVVCSVSKGKVQDNLGVQYSAVQYSTVMYSTLQYSAADAFLSNRAQPVS